MVQTMQIDIVQQYKADVAFKTLVEGVNDNLYFIPKYQRKFRWKLKQVQDLARSLVKGYPIPPIYSYRNDKGQLVILDGQQRIMSLYFYYIGKFIDSKRISAIDYRKLDVVNRKYYDVLKENYDLVDMVTYLEDLEEDNADNKVNISYQMLTVEMQRKIDYTTITIIELRWNNPESRFHDLQKIFANLNAQGLQLSAQELRNGIFNCPFYDMLREINDENESWKKIRGRESDEEEDMEFLLRLCTVNRNVKYENSAFLIENYQSNYAEWMDEFSKSAMQMKKENILYYKNILNNFFMHFHMNKILGLQKALLESLFVVIVKAGLNVIVTEEIVNTILAAPEYKENSRKGMVQKAKMNERWKGVYAVLEGVVERNS